MFSERENKKRVEVQLNLTTFFPMKKTSISPPDTPTHDSQGMATLHYSQWCWQVKLTSSQLHMIIELL